MDASAVCGESRMHGCDWGKAWKGLPIKLRDPTIPRRQR